VKDTTSKIHTRRENLTWVHKLRFPRGEGKREKDAHHRHRNPFPRGSRKAEIKQRITRGGGGHAGGRFTKKKKRLDTDDTKGEKKVGAPKCAPHFEKMMAVGKNQQGTRLLSLLGRKKCDSEI